MATPPEMARATIKQMCDVIEHRGPDDEGYFVRDDVALGMRRLSIIDLATGRQPLSNEDGTIWIIFNGEIYNHRELRHALIKRGHVFSTRSDTETIVHLYEEEGERCVERLRGMFAFAIWDQRDHKLFIARDRVGKKPLHYAFVRGTLIFGSEIKSLLQHPAIERKVNPKAISDFLSFGYVPDPATAFQNILRLPPGFALTLKNGHLRVYPYWDFNYSGQSVHKPARGEGDYVAQLRELITESVRLRLESDVPLGAFLSGGIDSTTVVATMAREMGRPVKTFSIGFSESDHDELAYARTAARHFHTDHHEFVVTPDVCKLVEEIVWHHDEPFADVSSIPTYVVSKMAREHVTVVLSGDGGDELFGGYDRYLVDDRRRSFDSIPSVIRKGLLRLSRFLPQAAYGKNFLRNASLAAPARYVDSLCYFSEDAKHALLTDETRSGLGKYNSADAFANLFAVPASPDPLDHLLYLDSKTYLPGDILTKVDRMTMAHSIEARAPLLDHKLIEFVQSIPAGLKLRGRETKSILKKAVAGLIPAEIINRPKQGFGVPIRKWINGELRELLHDTLTDKQTRERGLLNQRAVLAVLEEHRRGRRDNAHHLWGLLTLELWHRGFIDRRPCLRFSGAKRSSLETLAAGVAVMPPGITA
jgi:asparagine synthase (glutamine-hydrolysing)